jgi:alpha-tubulin suppressor-like RCC1 family protein
MSRILAHWMALARQGTAQANARRREAVGLVVEALDSRGNRRGRSRRRSADTGSTNRATLAAGTTLTAINAGDVHSLAVTSTGQALAWGNNWAGQLGDGTNTGRTAPVFVSLPAGTTVTAVEAGDSHSLAVTSTGQALGFGRNNFGQLGNGDNDDTAVPVSASLPAGTTVTAVEAGDSHSLALTSAGEVLAWGWNDFGQLGNGTNTSVNVPTPVSLPPGTTAIAIAAGDAHSLAVTSTGQVFAWGNNWAGQLGDGTNNDSNVPVSVSLPVDTTVTDISAGFADSQALTSTGQVLTWGLNYWGELGDGTNNDSNVPVSVSLPAGTTVTDISAGTGHDLALASTGQLFAWGGNWSGQLGDGTQTDRSSPDSVSFPTGTTVTRFATGYSYNLVVTATGQLLAWGNNFYGQLGNGTTTDSDVPVPINLPVQ